MGTAQAATESTALAEVKNVRDLLTHDVARQRIEPFLPPGATYERVIAGAHYAARQNPDILSCTPASIIDAVAKIQQWGLDIGTTAHLVPFNTKIKGKNGAKDQWVKILTPIADYKGIAELMVRSGAVRHVEAHAVHEGDQFSYHYGLESDLRHQPVSGSERGPITHAYVILRLPFNRSAFEVMDIGDIEAIRKQYSKQWGPDKIAHAPTWYCIKTVVRQASKLIPKDPRTAAVLRVIAEDESQDFDAPTLVPGSAHAALGAGEDFSGGVPTGVPDVPVMSGYAVHQEGNEAPVLGKASRQRAASAPDPMENEPEEEVDHELDDRWIEAQDMAQEMALNDKRPARRNDAIRDGGR